MLQRLCHGFSMLFYGRRRQFPGEQRFLKILLVAQNELGFLYWGIFTTVNSECYLPFCSCLGLYYHCWYCISGTVLAWIPVRKISVRFADCFSRKCFLCWIILQPVWKSELYTKITPGFFFPSVGENIKQYGKNVENEPCGLFFFLKLGLFFLVCGQSSRRENKEAQISICSGYEADGLKGPFYCQLPLDLFVT